MHYKKYKRIHCDTCNKYTKYELVKVVQTPAYYGTVVKQCIMAIHRIYVCPDCGSNIEYIGFETIK